MLAFEHRIEAQIEYIRDFAPSDPTISEAQRQTRAVINLGEDEEVHFGLAVRYYHEQPDTVLQSLPFLLEELQCLEENLARQGVQISDNVRTKVFNFMTRRPLLELEQLQGHSVES